MTTNSQLKKHFHYRFQYVVMEKKLKEKAFQKILGKDKATVSKWWNGKIVPGKANKELICEKFGVDYYWLSTGKGEPFPNKDDDIKTLEKITKEDNEQNVVSVTYVEDTYASAGIGIINNEEARQVMHFDRSFLERGTAAGEKMAYYAFQRR